MSASFNTKHYTYHLGTSLELNSCQDVYYYDSGTIASRLQTPSGEAAARPSITTIQGIFDGLREHLTETGQYCHREDPEEDFELTEGGTKSPCFDTLIYVDSNKTSVLGFTFFLGTQSSTHGNSRIGVMKLGFKFSIVNRSVDIRLSYTLDPVWSTKDPLLTDYFVTSRSEILSASGPNPKADYMRYTDDLLQLDSGDNFCTVTDTGTLLRNETWRFWIPPVIGMSRIKEYTDYTVGLWQGLLVLYRWNSKGDFSIDSLTSSNHFGVMAHLLDGRVASGPGETIRTFASGVAILDKGDREASGYSAVSQNHHYQNDSKRIISDPWSDTDRVQVIPNNMTAEDLGLRHLLCPPGKYYFLAEKQGPWYKFKNEKTGSFAWASLSGTAYFAKGTTGVLPWSDRVILKVSSEYIDVYSFDYDGTTGSKEYTLGSSPAIRIPTEYLGSEYKPLLDSLRHRPYRPGSLKELANSPVSFRGLWFYLSRDLKTIYYL